jgi:hypothetical protein
LDPLRLRSLINKRLRLSFNDGEVVEALLLGADPVRDRDLTYEVLRVVRQGTPQPRGSGVGATCVAAMDELAGFEVVE